MIGLTVALIIVFLVWILPIWIVATNNNIGQIEKLLYVVGMICLSWMIFIVYLAIAKSR